MRTLLAVVLASLATSLAAPDAAAQQPPVRSQRLAQAASPPRGGGKTAARETAQVSAEIMVVHATEDGDYIDPKLKQLERHLQYLKYSNYRVLKAQSLQLSENSSKKVSIEGDRDVNLTLLSVDGDKARFRVRVSNKQGNLADITISVSRDRTFIVSGPQYQGGILLIPITARF